MTSPDFDPQDWVAPETEPLHPDLQPYLEDLPPLGLVLRAPLVFQVPWHSYKLANRAYEVKQTAVQEALSKGRFERAIWLYERPYRLSTLYAWYEDGVIDQSQLRELLPSVWMDTEFPDQFGEMPRELFEEAGYVSDTEERLSGELTLYRGDHAPTTGIEWSLSRETAEWFARRFARPEDGSWLATGTANASDVRAYLVGRGENEVIVFPENVRNVSFESLSR